MCTSTGSSPAASTCASSSSVRSPCTLTRPNVSLTVVSAPTISNSPACRTRCSAQALSLPLDQEISAFGFGMVSALAPFRRRALLLPGLAAQLREHAFRRACAGLPRAFDGAPLRLVHGFAGEPDAAERLHQNFARIR